MTTVFAGPSIFGIDLQPFSDLQFLPPAKAGDFLNAAEHGAKAIVLIDGVFEAAPAVWHKEILYALAQGIPVYGAASLGALRAAECESFGMVGIGRIFRDYKEEIRLSDADVAVLHAPQELGFQPLTLALADVEIITAHLSGNQSISVEEANEVLRAARALYFKERNWTSILKRTELEPEHQTRLKEIFLRNAFSQKTRDAKEALNAVRGGVAHALAESPPFSQELFNKTEFLGLLKPKRK
jgi:hypothetical protein